MSNASFLEGSSAEFPVGPYDLVFANHVLHWVEDKEGAFRKVYTNLKSGGTFAFVCPVLTRHETVSNGGFWSLVHSAVSQCSFVVGSNTLLNLAIGCGFTVVFVSVEPAKYTFCSMKAYVDYALASLTFGDYSNVMGMIFERSNTSSEPVHMDWTRAVVILKK